MSLERWRPFGGSQVRWEGLTDVQQEMNRLFDSFFGRPATMTAGDRLWVPLVDMYETKDDLHIAFEVPGVREKEVSVSISGDLLTVKGERKWGASRRTIPITASSGCTGNSSARSLFPFRSRPTR